MACCAQDERSRVRVSEVGAGGLVDGDGEGRCQSAVTRKLLRRRPASSISTIPWTAVVSSRGGLPGERVAARIRCGDDATGGGARRRPRAAGGRQRTAARVLAPRRPATFASSGASSRCQADENWRMWEATCMALLRSDDDRMFPGRSLLACSASSKQRTSLFAQPFRGTNGFLHSVRPRCRLLVLDNRWNVYDALNLQGNVLGLLLEHLLSNFLEGFG
ncbi:uncharacterized protein [Triticum aestivum]|uniref:uncharacterized protein n=1 Tax=Triticum aestivum TaxID=4565 RepID=UPI001D00A593|nr:uncharacterized protein LOC123134083 [Triticum aestivum]